MAKLMFAGLDLGNNDTKTEEISKPSGFTQYSNVPFVATELLKYNNMYYVLDENRIPYTEDKTTSNHALILSLFGIAADILCQLKKEKNRSVTQEDVSEFKQLVLGIGLPPTHVSKLGEKTLNYYYQTMRDGIQFTYNKFEFSFKLIECQVYAQDFAAAAFHVLPDGKSLTKCYKDYVAIDIGGYTVDKVVVIGGRPVIASCFSKKLGIIRMYEEIIPKIEMEYGITLVQRDIENILRHKQTVIQPEVKNAVKAFAEYWATKIINELVQSGVVFDTTFALFIGGGSLLLKEFIDNNALVKYCDFENDTRANARGYYTLVKKAYSKAHGIK